MEQGLESGQGHTDAALTPALTHVHGLNRAGSRWEGSVTSKIFPYTLVNGAAQETARFGVKKMGNQFVLVQKAVLREGWIRLKG